MSKLIVDRGGLLVFPIGPKKMTLISCSYQVSFKSVQLFQRRCRTCLSQSQARAGILFFRSARKTQTWYRTLKSCFLSRFNEFRSAVSEKKSQQSQPIRGKDVHRSFPIDQKNKTVIEDIQILLTVKFRWIPVMSFREEVRIVKVYDVRTDGPTDDTL